MVDGLERQYASRLSVARVDVTTQDGEALCDKHDVRRIPAFLLLDAKGNVLYRDIGKGPDAAAIEQAMRTLGK